MNNILIIATLFIFTLMNIAITIHRKKYPKEIIIRTVPWDFLRGMNCRHNTYPFYTAAQIAPMETTEFDPGSCDG